MIQIHLRLLIALLLAFVLTILPWPAFIMGFRPGWILMLILYVQFFMPAYFNVTLVFVIGLCLDVLLSTVMGEHAFSLLFMTFVASGRVRRFHFFSLLQQMALVAYLCLGYQTILYVIDSFLSVNTNFLAVMGSSLLSMMVWPWVQWALMKALRRFETNFNTDAQLGTWIRS